MSDSILSARRRYRRPKMQSKKIAFAINTFSTAPPAGVVFGPTRDAPRREK